MSRQLLSGRGSEGASRSHGVSAAAWATWGGYGVPFPTVVVAGTTTVFFYRLNIPTLRREHVCSTDVTPVSHYTGLGDPDQDPPKRVLSGKNAGRHGDCEMLGR